MLVQCEVRQVQCPVAGGLAAAAVGATVLAGRFSAIRAMLLS